MIEYYDYSKSKNSLINELNNPNAKPKKNYNSGNSYPSKYQGGQGRRNFNNAPYNKFTNQNIAYSNQKFDNVFSHFKTLTSKSN